MAASARKAGEGVAVRIARTTDARALGVFLARAWNEAGRGALGFTGATDDSIREISSEEFLAQRIASPRVKMLVAESEGSIVGFASLQAEGPQSVELSGIVVLQSASGAGIGTRLIRKSFLLAAKLDFRTMTVRTETFNSRAIGFYRENGFTETAKETEKVGRTKVPILVLRKVLTRTKR
jgi:ribosomal protein S18 acetylase RimI-like enzyme